MPLFPYSRQPDVPYKKAGAPLSKGPAGSKNGYTFESVPPTPGPGISRSSTIGSDTINGVDSRLARTKLSEGGSTNGANGYFNKSAEPPTPTRHQQEGSTSSNFSFTTHDVESHNPLANFKSKPGYKQWVAQAGTLVADLLTCAGADHVVRSRCASAAAAAASHRT